VLAISSLGSLAGKMKSVLQYFSLDLILTGGRLDQKHNKESQEDVLKKKVMHATNSITPVPVDHGDVPGHLCFGNF
jgi:hypothetical protein